jgi:hypothetical protein
VARTVFTERPEWFVVGAALLLGVLGAVLAILFQWLAVGLGGFAVGVYGSLAAAEALGLDAPWLWALVLAAGIIGAALVLWLWDPVLIVLSALVGAALLAPLIPVPPAARAFVFVTLLVAGILVQVRVLAPPPAPSSPGHRGA